MKEQVLAEIRELANTIGGNYPAELMAVTRLAAVVGPIVFAMTTNPKARQLRLDIYSAVAGRTINSGNELMHKEAHAMLSRWTDDGSWKPNLQCVQDIAQILGQEALI